MPYYDYECPPCDKIFTVFRKVTERDEPMDCPKCQNPLSRMQDFKAVNVLSNVISIREDEYFTDYGSTQERLAKGIDKQREDFNDAKTEISRDRDRIEDKLLKEQ